jgi:hypothetical protein
MTARVLVTAGSGTVNPFKVWIEGSDDGVVWVPVICDLSLATSTAAGTATANNKFLVNVAAVVTSDQVVGIYKTQVLPRYLRGVVNISGTTPSETFELSVILT